MTATQVREAGIALRDRKNGVDPVIEEGSAYDDGDIRRKVVPIGAVKERIGTAVRGYWETRHQPRDPMAELRVAEVERLVRLRYQGPCDTAEAELYVRFVANHLVNEPAIQEWARTWTRGIAPATVSRLIDQASRSSTRWRADTAGKFLRLTAAERTQLDIRTIAPFDMSAEERAMLQKAKRKERERLRRKRADDAAKERERQRKRAFRKARGATPREQSAAAKWRALGISESTYYRRLRAAKAMGQNETGPSRDRVSSVAHISSLEDRARTKDCHDQLEVCGDTPSSAASVEPHRRSEAWAGGWIGAKAANAEPVAEVVRPGPGNELGLGSAPTADSFRSREDHPFTRRDAPIWTRPKPMAWAAPEAAFDFLGALMASPHGEALRGLRAA